MRLFSKAGPNGRTFLLDHGSLVSDGLGGSHIADELLDCGKVSCVLSVPLPRYIRELMIEGEGLSPSDPTIIEDHEGLGLSGNVRGRVHVQEVHM